jgi:hypothetical protein
MLTPSSPPSPPTQATVIKDDLAAELIADVSFALEDAAETDGVVVRDIVEWVIDRVITALRTDDRIPARTRDHWEAFFADAGNKATYDLHWLSGLIKPQQAAWAVEDFFSDRSIDDKPGAPQAGAGA